MESKEIVKAIESAIEDARPVDATYKFVSYGDDQDFYYAFYETDLQVKHGHLLVSTDYGKLQDITGADVDSTMENLKNWMDANDLSFEGFEENQLINEEDPEAHFSGNWEKKEESSNDVCDFANDLADAINSHSELRIKAPEVDEIESALKNFGAVVLAISPEINPRTIGRAKDFITSLETELGNYSGVTYSVNYVTAPGKENGVFVKISDATGPFKKTEDSDGGDEDEQQYGVASIPEAPEAAPKYTLIEADASTLDDLYKNNACVITGLAPESVPDWIEWFENHGGISKCAEVYHILGSVMNKKYGLKGSVRYPGNLNIYAISLDDIDVRKVALPMRSDWGGRWYTDIVDNNTRHNRGER